jgi:hypothetical protein
MEKREQRSILTGFLRPPGIDYVDVLRETEVQ